MLCKTDEDVKLIIINFTTYSNIMKGKMEQFQELNLSQNDYEKRVATVRKKRNNIAITLHEERVMDDNLLHRTIRLNLVSAYIYPLFKIHKLKLELLESTSPELIPTRLLQSARKIFSRFTAFLEYILLPNSVKFCQSQIDEYCPNSKNYLNINKMETKSNQKAKTSTYIVFSRSRCNCIASYYIQESYLTSFEESVTSGQLF